MRKQLLALSAQLIGIEKEVALLMERGLKVRSRLTRPRSHGPGHMVVCMQLQEELPQKLLPLVSSGMKSQAYLSQNTLVEMTLG